MPENEPTVPDGDYKTSCGGCRIQGAPAGITDPGAAEDKTLFCSDCTKTCGARITSQIDLSKCKVEDGANIYNSNGQLTCREPLPSNQDNLPAGSYSSSCHGCSVTQSKLTCTACLDAAKERHLSSIDFPGCKSLGNNHGKLQCDDAETSIPGSYSSSCQGCSLTGVILTCSRCKSDNGQEIQSSLDTSNCRSVGNSQGKLRCTEVMAEKDAQLDKEQQTATHLDTDLENAAQDTSGRLDREDL